LSQSDTNPEVGTFEFEVFRHSRAGRTTSSHFTLRCNAIGLHEREILLLSVIGPETSVKAVTAGLRSSTRDQERIEYTIHLGNINATNLTKCPQGYGVHRAKLGYGLWHALFLGKRPGFLPVLSEASLWHQLNSSQFTTPLLREWVPRLYAEMLNEQIVPLVQAGCHAGLVMTDTAALDKLVTHGLRKKHLTILDRSGPHGRRATGNEGLATLDEYLKSYGPLLGKNAEHALSPLHIPGKQILSPTKLLRSPFAAQAHVIEATRKALARQKSLLLVGEMGTGKSLMGMAAVHAHAEGRPYRALIFCPGQLTKKWEREIRETIPAAGVIQIDSWKTLLPMRKFRRATGAEWYIIARDRAKLGALWRPSFQTRTHLDDGFIRCSQCGRRLVDDKREPLFEGRSGRDGQVGTGLWKKRSRCEWVLAGNTTEPNYQNEGPDRLVPGCGSPLWQMTGEIRRYEPALFIKRHLKHYFDYLLADELHETKGADTAQGHAIAALTASCRKVIGMTGTLIGGYAEHLRPILFRLSPASLIQDGLGWSDVTEFSERYGRIETRITQKSGGHTSDNRMSRGSRSTIKCVRPGIMPPLFGRHLIDKCVFLGLNEVADNLPPLTEECIAVRMDPELAHAYHQQVEQPLKDAIQEMLRRQDRRLLGAFLQTLLAYPDHPFGWEPIGYRKLNEFVTVTVPPPLDDATLRPKEQALIELVQAEKLKKRKVWVFVQYTDKHDVQGRLEGLLKASGLQVGSLRSSVPLARREEWINKNAHQADVVISHPRLVETGLDLFDKGGRHNFPTLVFYETGYNLFTLRQASRRSWRIGQTLPCRVVYLYYASTMQDRALSLMGKKLTAAQALEGKFSSEGLVAMGGEDANVEIALARSLVSHMEEGDAHRFWNQAGESSPLANHVDVESRVFPATGSRQRSLFDLLADNLTVEPTGSRCTE
jgi:hypothetical protein